MRGRLFILPSSWSLIIPVSLPTRPLSSGVPFLCCPQRPLDKIIEPQILFRQGPMEYSQLQHVSFRGDVNGVAIRSAVGSEEAWLEGDREDWLDHLLSLLLPLVEYVETKQSLQMKSSKLAPPRSVA